MGKEPIYRAILLAAGQGHRFQHILPKQFHPLGYKKIYQHALDCLLSAPIFKEIIIVCHVDWVSTVQKELIDYPSCCRAIPGGLTRQESSFLGLQACSSLTDYILIHEAVRPFLSKKILKNHLDSIPYHLALDTCIPSTDTIIHTIDGVSIASIPDRKEYLRGQTPQTFRFSVLQEAHRTTSKKNVSDDCTLVKDLNIPVSIIEGHDSNIKITTPLDLALAQIIHNQQFK